MQTPHRKVRLTSRLDLRTFLLYGESNPRCHYTKPSTSAVGKSMYFPEPTSSCLFRSACCSWRYLLNLTVPSNCLSFGPNRKLFFVCAEINICFLLWAESFVLHMNVFVVAQLEKSQNLCINRVVPLLHMGRAVSMCLQCA